MEAAAHAMAPETSEVIPALMRYVERYGIDVKFESRLIAEIPQGHRRDLPRSEFAPDSPLEGDGFELPVPVRQAKLTRSCR